MVALLSTDDWPPFEVISQPSRNLVAVERSLNVVNHTVYYMCITVIADDYRCKSCQPVNVCHLTRCVAEIVLSENGYNTSVDGFKFLSSKYVWMNCASTAQVDYSPRG